MGITLIGFWDLKTLMCLSQITPPEVGEASGELSISGDVGNFKDFKSFRDSGNLRIRSPQPFFRASPDNIYFVITHTPKENAQ